MQVTTTKTITATQIKHYLFAPDLHRLIAGIKDRNECLCKVRVQITVTDETGEYTWVYKE